MVFTARRSYASAVLGVVILSVRPSVPLSHACFVTNPKNLPAIFLYHMKGQSIVKCDCSYSCAAADKILTDFKASRDPSAIAELYLYKWSRKSSSVNNGDGCCVH